MQDRSCVVSSSSTSSAEVLAVPSGKSRPRINALPDIAVNGRICLQTVFGICSEELFCPHRKVMQILEIRIVGKLLQHRGQKLRRGDLTATALLEFPQRTGPLGVAGVG